jgi:methionyl-tRNA formyltransferase
VTGDGLAPARIRTVFLGSGAFGVPSLHALAAHRAIDLVAVVTAPRRPAGRGQALRATPVDQAARALAIDPILTPARLRAPESIDALLALRPELVVLADYGQIVPPRLLAVPRGALNLHPSLLPRHRGATPVPAAILAGDPQTGVTLMHMDEGLDTGPIVAQRVRPLDGTETGPVLEAALADMAADLLRDELDPWLRGDLIERSQPVDGVTLTRPLRRDDGRLDVTRSAAVLERQVRAYTPWPGTFIDTPSGRLGIWSATAAPAPAGPTIAPGTITDQGISTSDGILHLQEVQPAGGRRMSWPAFVRGRPAIIGSIVGPTPG